MAEAPAPYRNSLEAAYAQHLAARKAAGEILDWHYELDHLLLDGHNLQLHQRYTPDFTVTLPDGTIEYHETKGYFFEQDRVRTKQAAARYVGNRFIVVTRKHGKWVLTPIKRAWENKTDSQQARFDAILRARRQNEREYHMRDYAYQAAIHQFLCEHPRFKPKRPPQED